MSNFSSYDNARKDATGLPVYGMDLELQAKQEARRSAAAEQEAEVREWITNLTGQAVRGGLETELKNGIILCNLINRIVPNKIRKINTGNMPFTQMENINNFLSAVREIGVPPHDLFMTVDLFEAKNIPQVIQCLYALGRQAARVPGYTGPTIGPRLAESGNVRHHEVRATGDTSVVSRVSLGSSGGASQAGTRSIKHEVVKTTDVGDSSSTSKLTQGSYGGASQAGTRSISNEIVKTNATGSSNVASRQTAGSYGGASQAGTRSIHNEVVRSPVPAASSSPAASSPTTGSSLADLEKLADLKAKGIITQAEFEAKKKQILGL